MSTHNPHVVATLARTSWTLPWLTTLAISAAIVWAMTALLASAASFALPGESAPARTETFAIGRACDGEANWQLIYARTTGRIPANYCPCLWPAAPWPNLTGWPTTWPEIEYRRDLPFWVQAVERR